MKGSDIFVESLVKAGADTVFGYPGGSVLEIYDSLYKSKNIFHLLTRHEQAAAHAADGYARTTGRVGVCLATSGPGATNLVTGIATAHMDSVPMVAFTGNVTSSSIGKDAFQEADIKGITMPITKHNYLVKEPGDLAQVIAEAFYIASSGRPGPVLIDIPKDVTFREAEFNYPDKVSLESYKPSVEGNARQIKAALELLDKKKKPLIFAGHGVVLANGQKELREFVKKTNIPVVTTFLGLGSVPTDAPTTLGMPGMHGPAYVNYAIVECDCIIAIGMRFDDRITGKISAFAQNAEVIHIDVDPAEISKVIPVAVPIVGDAKHVLKQLNEKVSYHLDNKSEWWKRINQLRAEFPLLIHPSKELITPDTILNELNDQLDGNAIYTTDVGTHQMWAAQYLKIKDGHNWASSGGLGTMGYGFPAAIGAQIGNPDKKVVCITGDGSFQMNIQELGTVASNGIPVKVIVFNNGHLGMVRQWQELFYGKRYSHTVFPQIINFAKIAEAYGIKGINIDKPKDLSKQLKEALSHKGPVIVDIKIKPDQNVMPMVPAGGTVDKMLFES